MFCVLKWDVAILRAARIRRAEGGEIHVSITTDSFDNPGECVLDTVLLCEVEHDRMQMILSGYNRVMQ